MPHLGRLALKSLSILAILSASLSCKTAKSRVSITEALGQKTGPRICAAIRGNGTRIFAHFASMARVLETYGPINATAGGSSGSITQFLYESIYMNPAIRRCRGVANSCSEQETGARAALLMKSLVGYLDVIKNTDEALALAYLIPIEEQLRHLDFKGLQDTNLALLHKSITSLFQSQELSKFKDAINPEVPGLFKNAKNPYYGAKEALKSVKQAVGDLNATSNTIFFRPGLLNWPFVAQRLGRIGSFYASYAPADPDGMAVFLDNCTEPSWKNSEAGAANPGLLWPSIAAFTPPDGQSCGEQFRTLVQSFRSQLEKNEANYPSRIADPVAAFLPMLVSDSVITGAESMKKYAESRQQYLNNAYTNDHIDFAIDFNSVRFGYWGRPEDLETAGSDPLGFKDAKSAKFLALGQPSWSEVLRLSPAEPGLANFQKMADDQLSAGGWSDLEPVSVLKSIGCEHVVYISRQGNESSFAIGVAHHLGMTAEQEKALYDLESSIPDSSQGVGSSFALALREASAVWCTNWNAIGGTDIAGLQKNAYFGAVLAVHNPSFLPSGEAYKNPEDASPRRGCAFGAPPLKDANN